MEPPYKLCRYFALSNLSIYYAWKNIKKSYENNKFEISAATWIEEFELPDGCYSPIRYSRLLWIHLENHETVTGNPSIKIYVNKIENTIMFKIKTWYYLELLMSETMKLLGSTKSKITKDENSENVPHLEITKVVLMHCNIVKNDYQQDSGVLYVFFSNKSFGQLQDISPKSVIFLKTFDSEFTYIEV